ncbi:MAG: hypothetical protein WBN25_14295, partial [Eudoraea sp.]
DKLDVNGQIRARNGFASTEGTVGNPGYGFYTNGDTNTGMYRAAEDQLAFTTGGNEAIRIDASQNVGIGVPNPSRKLHVGGDLQVDGGVWVGAVQEHPDYVFEKFFNGYSERKKSYKFLSLKEIEIFVKENHHLPGINSAKEVQKDGVWNISESNLQNLEKIEELFLHTINQEKEINQLKTKNESLSTELELVRKDLAEIKELLINMRKD